MQVVNVRRSVLLGVVQFCERNGGRMGRNVEGGDSRGWSATWKAQTGLPALLQPRHFLRRRKPLYWTHSAPTQPRLEPSRHSRPQAHYTSLSHLDTTRGTTAERLQGVDGLRAGERRSVKAGEESPRCRSAARSAPPEALAASSPPPHWLPGGQASSNPVRPSMDPFKLASPTEKHVG